MQKSTLILLFLFASMIGGWFYLEKIHFFEHRICSANGGNWSDTSSSCTTLEDSKSCREQSGVWIQEENFCDFGEIINR